MLRCLKMKERKKMEGRMEEELKWNFAILVKKEFLESYVQGNGFLLDDILCKQSFFKLILYFYTFIGLNCKFLGVTD